MNHSLLWLTLPQRWSLLILITTGLINASHTHAQIISTAAQLLYPNDIAVDGSGNFYITDPNNHRIRKVSSATGTITTLAGLGVGNDGYGGYGGYGGDGGAATAAPLNSPLGIAVNGSGNVYIADTKNQRIRKISSATGIITTVAGMGGIGYSGDGGAATGAKLNYPAGVAVDGSGNLYIVDTNNNRIRKVSTNGLITTVAGSSGAGYSGDGGAATGAKLNYPHSIAVDGSGNLYIADTKNQRIRKISSATGTITTVAGSSGAGYSGDGGAATAAKLNYPNDIAVDGSGNLYIADTNNQRIRKVSNATGIITTVAGRSDRGYGGDEGAATVAYLSSPLGIAVDGLGNLYIADTGNSRIRKVVPALTTTAPVATTNPNQTSSVNTAFSYTVNAFTDAETPNNVTYTARINPANGLSFNAATRVISGTLITSGVSSVTITATDPGSLSASTTFTITSTTACIGTLSPDYAALAELYNVTNGLNWTNKTNWLSSCSPCSWYGVTCNNNGRVTDIALYNNQLKGSLPASLSALTNLENLYLYNNQLSGNIPASLTALTNLTGLYLYDNQLSGAIPAGLNALTNLQALYLSNNQLSGPIPASLSTLSKLTSLDLSANQLSGSIPAGLGALTKLQFLILNNNQLSGCFPTSLSALCGGDQVVDFSNNSGLPGGGDFSLFCANGSGRCSYTNTAPVATANTSQTAKVGTAFSYTINAFTDAETPNGLTYTARIDPANGLSFNPTTRVISGTLITSAVSSVTIMATDPTSLSASTAFTITSTTACPGTTSPDYATLVDLYNATNGPNWTYKTNWLSDCSPCGWYGIACNSNGRVTTISLHDNHLNGTIPASLSALTNLQILAIFNNQLSGPIPDGLSKLTNLQRLGLYNNRLSGCFPVNLSALCGGNRIIDFSNNPSLPGGGNFGSFCSNGTGSCSPTNTAPVATTNTAPVAKANANQTATVGIAFTYTVNAFADAETPNALTYIARIDSVNGLRFNPTTRVISGTPITTGVSSVTIIATDPGNLSASTTFGLLISPPTLKPDPTVPFALTGVTTVSCQAVSAGQRRVTFSPQYAGLTNQPLTFGVTNEMVPTTNPGPYTLNLYTDNPTITLNAQQGSATATFRYNWLAACNANGRLGAEPTPDLTVLVLGNPVTGESVEVEVRGAAGQMLHLQTVNGQGRVISQITLERPGLVERRTLDLERSAGLYFLQVSTPTRRQVVKVLKP